MPVSHIGINNLLLYLTLRYPWPGLSPTLSPTNMEERDGLECLITACWIKNWQRSSVPYHRTYSSLATQNHGNLTHIHNWYFVVPTTAVHTEISPANYVVYYSARVPTCL